eukprot:scaffold194642_cov24-Tisochrysis_lutea.AAC.1
MGMNAGRLLAQRGLISYVWHLCLANPTRNQQEKNLQRKTFTRAFIAYNGYALYTKARLNANWSGWAWVTPSCPQNEVGSCPRTCTHGHEGHCPAIFVRAACMKRAHEILDVLA